MPATTDTSRPTPRRAGTLPAAAIAAGAAVFALAGLAAADPEPSSGIKWHSPEGLAGVDTYRLDFLSASGLAPLSAPMRPTVWIRGSRPLPVAPVVPVTSVPEDPNIRPVAADSLSGIEQPEDDGLGGGSYSLSDAVRDAGWRRDTARRLRSLIPSRTAF